MLDLKASQQGTNSFSQPKVIYGPGLNPVDPPPPAGFSHPFKVDQQPVLVVADTTGEEGWEAQLQISPDNGETFTDMIIHDRDVVLNASNTSLLVPVAGTYRLRSTAATTFSVYTSTLTHEPMMPMVNLAKPGPTGATGAVGATGGIGNLPTPYDFGAVGDGVADDTVAMQAWLDAITNGAGYGKAGTFRTTATIFISGNTTIYGAGRGSFIIKRNDGATQLLQNKNQGTDENIAVYGTCFQGDAAAVTAVEMCGFGGVNNLTFRDCLFQHWRRFLTAFSTCTQVNLDKNEFYDWGSTDPVPIPGACQFDGGYAVWMGIADSDINITDNFFHDGEWHPILAAGERFIISGNHIQNTKEGGMFCPGLNQSLIARNIISGVVMKDCAACGIEFFGSRVNIVNNFIFNVGDAAILLTDSELINVEGNICDLSSQGAVSSVSPYSAVVGIRTLNSNGDGSVWPQNITIANNQISGRDNKVAYAIGLYDIGVPGALPMDNISIIGNNLGPLNGWRLGAFLFFGATVRGDNFLQRDNNESSDTDKSLVQFIIPSGQTTDVVVSGAGFQPRSIDFQAVLPAVNALTVSFGQCGWATGWSVPGQVITGPRTNFVSSSIFWATDGTNSTSGPSGTELCINVVDSVGGTICAAKVLTIDPDGFTLQMDSASTNDVLVNAVCYP